VEPFIIQSRNIVYEKDGLTYTEIIQQKNENFCTISAGFVTGADWPENQTIYVKVEKDEGNPSIFFLRPDEAQTLIWALSGVLWSYLNRAIDPKAGG
jgi:hypothetical protein